MAQKQLSFLMSRIKINPPDVSFFSFSSYNVHGYRQGIPLFRDIMCDPNESYIDCKFIQEAWLSSKNLGLHI